MLDNVEHDSRVTSELSNRGILHLANCNKHSKTCISFFDQQHIFAKHNQTLSYTRQKKPDKRVIYQKVKFYFLKKDQTENSTKLVGERLCRHGRMHARTDERTRQKHNVFSGP